MSASRREPGDKRRKRRRADRIRKNRRKGGQDPTAEQGAQTSCPCNFFPLFPVFPSISSREEDMHTRGESRFEMAFREDIRVERCQPERAAMSPEHQAAITRQLHSTLASGAKRANSSGTNHKSLISPCCLLWSSIAISAISPHSPPSSGHRILGACDIFLLHKRAAPHSFSYLMLTAVVCMHPQHE